MNPGQSKAQHNRFLGPGVALLFFLSGATGLAYEVVWFKRFAQLWGSSSLSMACVVTCFLLGLGAGAKLAGRIADASPSPLKLYGWCELAIAVMALCIPWVLRALFPLASELLPRLLDAPVLQIGLRLGLSAAVLLPPTLLMGATLPLLVRQLALIGAETGQATAWLYFCNSAGAATGAWFAGFVAIPELGLVVTNNCAVLTNVVLGVAALTLSRTASQSPQSRAAVLPASSTAGPAQERPSATTVEPVLGGDTPRVRWLNLAVFSTGAAALALQMVWVRQLAVMLGGTTYAFTAVLCVFILGIACGSLLFRMLDLRGSSLRSAAAAATVILVLSAFVGDSLRPEMSRAVGFLSAERGRGVFNAVLCMFAGLLLQGIPTLCMGFLFPFWVTLAQSTREHAGRAVGRVYAWNTAGSILAAAFTTVWLLPMVGSHAIWLAALAAYPVALLAVFPSLDVRLNLYPLMAAGGSGLLLLIGAVSDERDPRETDMGFYLYGGRLPKELFEYAKVRFYREGRTANVMVIDSEIAGGTPPVITNLRVNGKIDGGNALDMNTQLGSAYFPRFLRPTAQDVLVIGFGTGTTSGASLLFPGTAVDTCEIEPAIVEASRFFHSVNHAPELSPSYRTLPEDGRSWVQSADRDYDLIISEPSNPWMAGIGNLYTLEYYRSVQARLREGGMLTQWVQAYALGAEAYGLILATVDAVFENVALVRIDEFDTLLLASDAPLISGKDELLAAQELVYQLPDVRRDLLSYFGTDDVRALLLRHWFLDNDGIAGLVAGATDGELNTDANLLLEYRAPRFLFGGLQHHADLTELLYQSLGRGPWSDLIESWGSTDTQVLILRELRAQCLDNGALEAAQALARTGVSLRPDDPEFLVDLMLDEGISDLTELEQVAGELARESPRAAQRLGAQLGRDGRSEESAVVYRALVAELPRSATAQGSLSIVLNELELEREAQAARERASSLDPLNDFVWEVEQMGQPLPGTSAARN